MVTHVDGPVQAKNNASLLFITDLRKRSADALVTLCFIYTAHCRCPTMYKQFAIFP